MSSLFMVSEGPKSMIAFKVDSLSLIIDASAISIGLRIPDKIGFSLYAGTFCPSRIFEKINLEVRFLSIQILMFVWIGEYKGILR